MHKYLMEISRYFGGTHTFIVIAENKADAMTKGEIEISRNPLYNNDVYSRSLRVVKKLQDKEGG